MKKRILILATFLVSCGSQFINVSPPDLGQDLVFMDSNNILLDLNLDASDVSEEPEECQQCEEKKDEEHSLYGDREKLDKWVVLLATCLRKHKYDYSILSNNCKLSDKQFVDKDLPYGLCTGVLACGKQEESGHICICFGKGSNCFCRVHPGPLTIMPQSICEWSRLERSKMFRNMAMGVK